MQYLPLYAEGDPMLRLVVGTRRRTRQAAIRLLHGGNDLIFGSSQILKVILNYGPQRKSRSHFVDGRVHAERQPETTLRDAVAEL